MPAVVYLSSLLSRSNCRHHLNAIHGSACLHTLKPTHTYTQSHQSGKKRRDNMHRSAFIALSNSEQNSDVGSNEKGSSGSLFTAHISEKRQFAIRTNQIRFG